MKHILFLTHYFPPEVNAPANRTFEHAVRWVKEGVKVTIITNHPNHPNGKLFPGYKNRWISRENVQGIDVVRVKTYVTPNKGTVRRSINYLFYMVMAVIASRKIHNINVVIATTPQFFCGIAGMFVCKLKNKPFVLEVRDLWPDSITAVNAVKKNLLIKGLIKIERRLYFAADKIVTLTNAFKQHIIGYGYPENRIVTVTNGIDFHRMAVVKPEKCDFAKNNRFVVSYIGTFGLAHKLETILEAADLLREQDGIHFLLIGDGADRSRLEKIVRDKFITNITLLPLQAKENIPYYLNLSEVGLIMLKNNRLFRTVIPSKMFEYMGFSKPIIVSVPEGEATHIVEKHHCGIKVIPESPVELMKAILDLYADRKSCSYYGKNGLDAVTKYFDRDNLAQRLLHILEQI